MKILGFGYFPSIFKALKVLENRESEFVRRAVVSDRSEASQEFLVVACKLLQMSCHAEGRRLSWPMCRLARMVLFQMD